MTHEEKGIAMDAVLQPLFERGFDGMQEVLATVLNVAMRLEREKALGAAPHERTEDRRGYANGFKPKGLKTRMGELALQVPQVRGDVSFYPSALERGQRGEKALALAAAEMYVNGVSTRRVRNIVETMCGFAISAAQVSEASKTLDVELVKWRHRPIGCIKALVLDALYEKVRIDGSVVSCAVLIATGVRQDGRRTILGISAKISEAEPHWRAFLQSLKERDLHGLAFIVSDNHEGLKAALRATFPGTPWQRCQTHLQRNAQAYITKADLRGPVPPTSAPFSMRPPGRRPSASWRPPARSTARSRPSWPPGWRTTSPTASPFSPSPSLCVAACAPATWPNRSTARSVAAPASSASSRTRTPCCASSRPS